MDCGLCWWWNVVGLLGIIYILEIAQHTTSISNSITAYLDSVLVRNHDPVWTRFHVPAVFCCNMKPRPWWLASVDRRVGLLASKYDSTGVDVRVSLIAVKACWWSGDQRKLFLVLRSGRSGVSICATTRRELIYQAKEWPQICSVSGVGDDISDRAVNFVLLLW